MTAVSERLDAIEAQLDAATPGPWGHVEDTYRSVPMLRIGSHNSGADVAQVILHAAQDKADAAFIAAAPENIRCLLDLARKQQAALDAVQELAGYLDGLAPGDKHYAGLIRKALEGK